MKITGETYSKNIMNYAKKNPLEELSVSLQSNVVVNLINTIEENRVIDEIIHSILEKNKNNEIFVWDLASGIVARTQTNLKIPASADQEAVLDWLENATGYKNKIFLILKDYVKFIEDEDQISRTLKRRLKNFTDSLIDQKKQIIIIDSNIINDAYLISKINYIEWSLPTFEMIKIYLLNSIEDIKKTNLKFKTDYSEREIDEIAKAFCGLALHEVERILNGVIVSRNEFDLKYVSQSKKNIIERSKIVEWLDSDGVELGGLNNLKNWLEKRKDAFTQDALEFGLPGYLNGLLLIGVSGSGKTLASVTIGKIFKIPILRLDVGKVFSSLVGSSESNMRQVLKIVESVSPCVLQIDELDKAFSGMTGSGNSDGGTASRVFGHFLTWMEEKKTAVFVIATANDISKLPPEFLRKGRFDEIFFFDFPNQNERQQIIEIHLRNKKRDPAKFDVKKLSEKSENFTGAEIQAAIESALYSAFYENKRELTTLDIEKSFSLIIPLYDTMKEDITRLREWAKNRAVYASCPESSVPIKQNLGKVIYRGVDDEL